MELKQRFNEFCIFMEEKWYLFWRLANYFWPIVTVGILNFLSAILGVYQVVYNDNPALFLLFAVSAVVGYIIIIIRQSATNYKINVYEQVFTNGLGPEEALNKLLALWVNDLRFNHSHRVNVYKHAGGRFYRIGRFCPDPPLSEKGAKTVYEKGVIGQAWEREEFIEEGLPDPKDLDAYCAELKKRGLALPKKEVKRIRFKARSYYAFRVTEPEGQHSMAIILFESKLAKGFDNKKLKYLLQLPLAGVICKQISQRELPPDAKQKGF